VKIKVYYTTAGATADWTLQDGLDVSNTLTVTSGTLTSGDNDVALSNFTQTGGEFVASSTTTHVSGNFDRSAGTGTFTHSSGNVDLNGADSSTQTISGSTTFNDLTISTASNSTTRAITFTAGTTQTVSGTWTVTGYSGKVITLQSSTTSTYALSLSSTPSVTYSDISYLAATGDGTPFCATYSQSTSENNSGFEIGSGASCNGAPANNSLTFTNPYGGSGNTAIDDDTTEWNFRALVTDDDGSTDIDYVELHLANSSDSTAPYDSIKLRWTQASDTFSEQTDTQNAVTLTSTSAESNASGDQWTLDFKFQINDSFLAKDTEYAAELLSVDNSAASDSDNYADFYQVSALTLSISVDSPTLAFGGLLPNTVVSGTTVVTVSTNYNNGYTLSAHDGVDDSDSALLHTDQSTRIADYSAQISSPSLWDGTGLGISVYVATSKDTDQWGTGTTETDSNNKYAGVPEIATIIHTKSNSPTSGDQTSVGYKLVVGNNQKTGDYAGAVTFTATGVLD